MNRDDFPPCQPDQVDRIVKWARATHQWLRMRLGNACACCGATRHLELDHIDPSRKSLAYARAGYARRATLYRRDYFAGNLQLLCRSCNARKGTAVIAYTKPLL